MYPDRTNVSLPTFFATFFFTALAASPAAAQAADGALAKQPAATIAVKNIRTRRVGPQLTALHKKYAAHRASGSAQAFASQVPHMQVANDMVVIDMAADGDVDELKNALASLGAVNIASFKHVVSARLPLAAIPKLADVQTLRFARPVLAMTRVGAVTSQGDVSMKTDDARTAYGVDGSGITVGVLSDTFDSAGLATTYADDVATLDLPAGVENLFDPTPGSDEGRAMAQLIFDAAPGADISFHSAFTGEAVFALGIQELAGCPPGSEPGCTAAADPAEVIVDDVGYFATPFFQDGIVAQAVDVVAAADIPYFSAAGNSARASWQFGPFDPSGVSPPGIPFGPGDAHDFDPAAGPPDIYQLVDVPSDTFLSFQWDQPYFSASGTVGSANDFDFCFYDEPPGAAPVDCSVAINVGDDPVEVLMIPGVGPVNLVIYKYLPDGGPDPGLLKWIASNDGVSILEPYPGAMESTSYGQPNAAGAIGVGAAGYFATPEFGVFPAMKEPFSSAGGTPILFDIFGAPVPPFVRFRPQIVGPDGTNTTFFGSDFEPDGFPNFFGTSAAAPHAAAIAALMLEASPNLTQRGVENVLVSSALFNDMGPPGFDFDSGFGFVDAEFAVGAVEDDGSALCDGAPFLGLFGTANDGPATFSSSGTIFFADGDFSDVTAFADTHIFADGFESGDTSSWSTACP